MACCRKLSHRQTFYTPKNFTGLSDTQLGDSWRKEMGPRLEECPRVPIVWVQVLDTANLQECTICQERTRSSGTKCCSGSSASRHAHVEHAVSFNDGNFRHPATSQKQHAETIGCSRTGGDRVEQAGVAEAMRLLDPMLKVERQADPVHLSQAQFRQGYKEPFSERMFPTAKTRQ